MIANRLMVPVSTRPRRWRDNTGADATAPTRRSDATPVTAATLAVPTRVVHPAAGAGEQSDGDRQAHDEQPPRQSRGVAHVVVDKASFVEIHHVEQRRIVAPGRLLIDHGGGEEVLERGHRSKD